MLTLAEIQTEVNRLAAKIGATGSILPTYGRSEDFARPHIEVDARGYHFVVVERGREFKRLTTRHIEELLETIFRNVTSDLAFNYELAHRVERQDCRRIAFEHQIQLLSILSSQWADREAQRHAEILRTHPFDDLASLRATLCGSYRDMGHSPESAWSLACEEFPLPRSSSRTTLTKHPEQSATPDSMKKQKQRRICPACKGTGLDPASHQRYTTGGHDDRSCPRCHGECFVDENYHSV